MSLQVTNSPFDREQVELINRLLPSLTESQRIWLSGYLAALSAFAGAAGVSGPADVPSGAAAGGAPLASVAVAAPTDPASREVTVLFGSQTGNSSGLAKKLAKKLGEQGFQATVSGMSDFKPNNLKKVKNLLLIASTHGEGEPPDNAVTFYEFLHSKRAPQLEDTRYSVLALGDTSYEFFCQTGKDFDKRLEELGAKRLAPRVDCDVDFEEPAAKWASDVLQALNEAAGQAGVASSASAVSPTALVSEPESDYSRSNPFRAEVLENLNLNGRGSERETRHVEISLEGSNLAYEPGDSIGIYPENDPQLVAELIATMGWQADAPVPTGKSGESKPLAEALRLHYELTVLTKPLLEQAAKLTGGDKLQPLLAPGNEQSLKSYMADRDLLDLVREYDLKGIPAAAFVSILRKLPPRLYSISSSPKATPDEVHITARAVRYEANGRARNGVCSVFLAERAEPGTQLPVFIQHNPNFKLPESPDTPMIMIGPGTGVAPFRAFLADREETGAEGKTWLFFGDQRFATDFLYQIEWQRWLKDGVLTRMDVAFSRDTDKKVYVQHRMLEHSRELYEWLQAGAHVYVCGDEKKMAHDVQDALTVILEREGDLSREDAKDYLARMQQDKRYQRDVY